MINNPVFNYEFLRFLYGNCSATIRFVVPIEKSSNERLNLSLLVLLKFGASNKNYYNVVDDIVNSVLNIKRSVHRQYGLHNIYKLPGGIAKHVNVIKCKYLCGQYCNNTDILYFPVLHAILLAPGFYVLWSHPSLRWMWCAVHKVYVIYGSGYLCGLI